MSLNGLFIPFYTEAPFVTIMEYAAHLNMRPSPKLNVLNSVLFPSNTIFPQKCILQHFIFSLGIILMYRFDDVDVLGVASV